MRERGFSLLEVLVAMAVVFILMIGTAELILLSLWAKKKGDTAAGTAQALSARLETLKSLAFESESLRAGTYSATEVDASGAASYLEEWTIEDAGERQKKIRITISPAGLNGAGSSLVFFISKDLGFEP